MKALSLTIFMIASPVFAGHEFASVDLDVGLSLYQENCASCHGNNLEGQPNWRNADENGILPAPPHDKSGHTWHHDSRFLFSYVKFGGQAVMDAQGVAGFTSAMPSFQTELSDEQIIDILGYIHSTWPDDVKDAQATRTQGH
jgi:mono/diheme cytochrome c family protein